jgi:hypothetical protein
MRAREHARSVAAMRPSLLPGLAVAALAAAAATPAHAKEGVYGGTTTSGDSIVLKTDKAGTKLNSVVISWRATCPGGYWVPGGGELAAADAVPGFTPARSELLMSINAKGRFEGTQLTAEDFGEESAAIVVKVAGTLKPAKAAGKLQAAVTIVNKTTLAKTAACSARLKWQAAREPGLVYGGKTSQDQPVVLRLAATRHKVADLLTTWFAPCAPGGYYRFAEDFTNFAVKAGGSFGNPFTDDVAMDAGGKRHFDYRVGGRVTKTAAKGTLQVKVADTDAAGAPGSTCDSGGLTWKAATG